MSDLTVITPGGRSAVGKYRIDGVLGEGAMGVVYAGHDPDIDRKVAIKTVHRHLVEAAGGEDWLGRFAREARAAGRVLHPNLVTVFDYLQDGPVPYLIMELVQAQSLEDLLKTQDQIDLRQIRGLFSQVLDGLACIHNAGIVHRDMKPANVMLTEDGTVKLTDFGIARLEAMEATGAGMIGTPAYMAPEQFTGGSIDARADIYACGVLLYELTTGRKPFEGGAVEAMFQAVRKGNLTPPSALTPALPTTLDAVVLRAMAVDAEDRFADVAELSRALAGALPGDGPADATVIALPSRAAPASGDVGANTMLRRMSSRTMTRIEQHLIAAMGPMGRIVARRAASNSMAAEDMIRAVLAELSAVDEHETMRASLLACLAADAGPPAIAIPDANLRIVADLLTPELGPVASLLVKRTAARTASRCDLVTALADKIADSAKRAGFEHSARTALGLSQG